MERGGARAAGADRDLVPANSNDPLYAAAFSPDGKLLAAAGAGGVVPLWEVSGTKADRLGRPLRGPTSTVFSIAFSPDSGTLAAASADGTVRLWHVADPARATPDGAPLVMPGGGRTRTRSRSAPTGGRSRPAQAGTVWLWRLPGAAGLAAGGAPAPLAGMPLRGPADSVSGVAFSPDGREPPAGLWPSGSFSALLADWWSLPTGLRRPTPPSATRVQDVGEHAPANRLPHL